MSLQTLGMIALAALCAGMFWTAIKYFYAAYQFRSGRAIVKRVRLPDAPVPEALTELETVIRGLGFTPKITMQYQVAGQPKPVTLWIYEHAEFNIELDLAESAGEPAFWVALETNFADGALLITSYPRGLNVDSVQVKAHFAAYSLQEAFDHHLLTQLDWTALHGDTRPLEKEAHAFFVHSADIVKRHGRVLYAQPIRQYIGGGVSMIGYMLVVLGLASQFLAGESFFNFSFLTTTTLSFLAGLALAVGGNGWANRGKTPPAVDADRAPVIDPKMHPLNRPVRMS